MMEGIRVLAETPIYAVDYSWGWSLVGLIFGILGLLFLGATIMTIVLDDIAEASLFTVVFIVCFAVSTISFGTKNKTETYNYSQYKVLISEDVNFIEFNNKYEIINQEGEIFTIKERS